VKRSIVLVLLLYAQAWGQEVLSGGASGGSGSGTVSDGATLDLSCYSDTNTVAPCGTGNITAPSSSSLKFDDVTLSFTNGVLTIQDLTPTTGSTQIRLKGGPGQATTPLLVFYHSDGTVMSSFSLQSTSLTSWSVSGNGQKLEIRPSFGSAAGTALNITNNVSGSLTSGTWDFVNVNETLGPTSGTGVLNLFTLEPTVNQTGGASGITRGLYVKPTMTSAADFRGIEVSDVGTTHYSVKTGTGDVDFGGPLAPVRSATEPVNCAAAYYGYTYFDTGDVRLCVCINDGTDDEWVKSDDYTHATGHCTP
jgi:hypothetical protein